MARPELSADVARRFWAKVIPEPMSGCWLWMAAVSPHGYGVIGLGGKRAGVGFAHRVSLQLAGIEIPAGLSVLHRCDNPPCVNPAHLFFGTQADNIRDMDSKGRRRHPAPGQRRRCDEKLSPASVIEIRAALARGERGADIAPRFGVSQGSISRIKLGQGWRWV